MIEYYQHRCLIRESLKIRTLLNERFSKLELSSRDITYDARNSGREFTEANLCRYRKHGNIKGSLKTADIIWLCERYGIELTLKVKKNGRLPKISHRTDKQPA